MVEIIKLFVNFVESIIILLFGEEEEEEVGEDEDMEFNYDIDEEVVDVVFEFEKVKGLDK